MYSDDEKRKQEMLQRIMQNKQEYDAQENQRKQEMFTRIMKNEKSPTAYRPKTSTSVTTRLNERIQNTTPNATSNITTKNNVEKIDLANLTPEQKKKLEEVQRQTSQNKIQLNTNPDNSNKVLKTIGNTGRKISDTFGINNIIKNSKEVAKNLPEEIRETSTISPALMGIRSSIAGIADAGATEVASLLEEKEREDEKFVKYLPIVGNMYRGYKTGEKVIHKAQEIATNGGNAGDVIWGAGSKLATEQFNNIKQNIPTYAVMDKLKQGIQNTTTKNLDEETRKDVQNNILNITSNYNEDLKKYQENESQKSSKMQFVDRAVEGTTRMLPTIALSVISGDPSFGLAAMGVSAKGSSTKQTLNDGVSLNQAVKIGDMKATVEVLTELATSGISAMGLGKKVLGPGLTDDIVQKLVLDKIKNKGLKMGASITLDVLGEIAEEIVADVADSVIDRGTYKEDAKLPTAKELWQTARDTTATTLLLNTITGGFIQNYRDINQPTMAKPANEQNPIINQNNNQQQQINQTENKNGLNQNVEAQNETKFSKILNNKELPMQRYNYEKSDNVKIDSLRQQANKFFNNSQEAHNYVNMLEKIIADKNIQINLDASLGEGINGKYENGVITINPNSNRAGEFLAIHELTHAIGTDSMIKMVENYRKSNAEFDDQVKKLLSNYNQTELNEEALADVAGQLFGNQEYINNLAKTNPNVFKTIYNEIKYLWHQFTGYKNQDQFVDDLMFKWEQAYRSNNELNQTTHNYFENVANFNELEYNSIENKRISSSKTWKSLKDTIDSAVKNKEIFPGVNEIELYDYGDEKYKKYTIYYKDIDNWKIADEEIVEDYFGGNNGAYKYSKNIDSGNGATRSESINNQWNNEQTENGKETTTNVELSKRNKRNSDSNRNNNNEVNRNQTNGGLEKTSSFNLPKTDNKGNVLSQQQQEFFKDSKVRDENGKLLIIYHGTRGDFNIFDIKKSGINFEDGWSMFGKGFYFTPSVQDAEYYADAGTTGRNINVKKCYLDIKNPFYTNNSYKNELQQILKKYNIKDYWILPNSEKGYGIIKLLKDQGLDSTKVLMDFGFDGIIQNYDSGEINQIVAFYPEQIKNIDNKNPTSNPDIRYSKNNGTWQEYLEKEFPANGTRTNFQDIKLPTKENMQKYSISNQDSTNLPQRKNVSQNNDINLPPPKTKKTLNPTEISNLTEEDANTTPKLPKKNTERGNKQSSFLGNILNDAQFLDEDLRHEIASDEGVQYYRGITNEETLAKAFNELKEDGEAGTMSWFNQDSKKASAIDTVKGWILLKQYQDKGDYQSAVQVAKKMREIGTNAGQTVQAFNILSRLTPEGMVYYAQSELSEAYNEMVKNKSKAWIDKNASNFDLTPQETQQIIDIMEEVGKMKDGYGKRVKLAEVQKIITDKIPPSRGQGIKAWMRISMLFNPKTQVRNVMGNAVILPVNTFSDIISTGIDKVISKKTGVRTTSLPNVKQYAKGFGKGIYESYNDFRKGINTRNIEGNRFEIGEGKSFKNRGLGKALNKVDNLLSFALDVGDRGFYEATFTNSINNQLIANKTDVVTQEMIDIATQEALQRTWQDNNGYTQSVLNIRRILNKVGTKGYGLGDVLIPFAKTPANLTKAIVDYSPVGLTKTLTKDAMAFNRSLENGQYNAQLQHKFVQDLGKGMAGTTLYVLAYALAKAGIATGEPDDDKDVKNFMKNSLGINSYSIKIGDKSYTYDWAQPVAVPLAIMTNYVKYSKDNPDASAIEKAIQSANIGTDQLLEQSFMKSLNTVLNGNGTFMENLAQAALELPARAIPTFSKQIADMVDPVQRTSFEYKKPVQSAINSVKAKIPGLSKTLPASVDTLGNTIMKYGGENNAFNVFLNPANVNKGELSKAGQEIYDVYNKTGDASVLPQTAPYYINSGGNRINMDAEQRIEFQTVMGQYVEDTVNDLLKSSSYRKLSNDSKSKIISEVVSDSYSKAKKDVLNISGNYDKTEKTIKEAGASNYYLYKNQTQGLKKDSEKIEKLANMDINSTSKKALYKNTVGLDDDLYNNVMTYSGININEYLKYKQQEFSADKKDDGTENGKSVSGSKKTKVYNYVNNMKITGNQRLLLLGTQYKLTNSERQVLASYVQNLNITNAEKKEIYSKLQGFTVYKDGRITY